MEKEGTVTQHILKYLTANPGAGDTLEGIAKWWVMRQQLNDSVDAVQTALESLMTTGLIVERKAPDGRVLYFCTQTRRRL